MESLYSDSVVSFHTMKCNQAAKEIGLIFQCDTKERRFETRNSLEGGRQICTGADYPGKHKIF
jgi:hypothetical protein